jgi:hypothetical protein
LDLGNTHQTRDGKKEGTATNEALPFGSSTIHNHSQTVIARR